MQWCFVLNYLIKTKKEYDHSLSVKQSGAAYIAYTLTGLEQLNLWSFFCYLFSLIELNLDMIILIFVFSYYFQIRNKTQLTNQIT